MKPFLYLLVCACFLQLTNAQTIKKNDTITKKTSVYCELVTCYKVNANEFTMMTWQDVYNALTAKVPGIRIYNRQIFQTPEIVVRNEEVNVIYIDGMRATPEALQAISPADIESITVLPNAGNNYIPYVTN